MEKDRRKMAAAFAVVAMVMAVAVIAPTTSEVEEADGIVIEASLLAIGLVASVIYGAGVGTGWLIGEVTDPVAPASDQEEVYKQLRGLYSETLVSNMNTAKNLISSVMPADTSLWSFTTNYWNRATELSVADYWTMDNEYDANMMTEQAMLRQNVESYIYDWQAAVDSAYNNITQKHTKLTGDCYGDMAFSVVWSGGTYTADGSSTFGIDLLQVIDGTQSGTTVYIDGSTEDAGDNFNESTSGTIYVNGSNSVTLRYIDTGQTFSLHGGLNTVSNVLPSGLYRIETSRATIAGPFTMAADSTAADVEGGLVIQSGDDFSIVTANSNGVDVETSGGSSVSSQYLRFEISYDGTDGAVTDTSVICDGEYNIVRDWNDMIAQINQVIQRASTAGETIWGIFDAAQESNSFLSPSSITASVPGVTLDAVQSQAIYIQSMMQIVDYWQQYGDDLSHSMEFTTNRESLDLYCYGDIYYNGKLWAQDVIFTPYMTVGEQTLTTNGPVEWNGPGYAMVWASAESWSEWDGSTSVSEYRLIDLSAGYELVLDKIVSHGDDVSEITLKQTTIERYNTGSDDIVDPPEPVKVLDASTLIMIIILLIALCTFLICYIAGQTALGLILALIIAVIGLVFPDTIASMALR